METIERNIGSTRGKRRIWIEGKTLSKFGWTKGKHYVQGNFENPFVILLVKGTAKGNKLTEKRVAGTETRPIIDLCGNYVAKLFEGYKTVKILITTNSIEIKGNE